MASYNYINESMLAESCTARTSAISSYSDERAVETINKAKALVFANWQGTGIAINKQLAEYFGVNIDAIESVLRRNRDELTFDGVKNLTGKEACKLSVKLTESSNTNRLTVWTPRGVLRLGMLLRDSIVAKELRTVILNVVDSVNPTIDALEKQFQPDVTVQNQLDALRILKAGCHKDEYLQRVSIQFAKSICPSIEPPLAVEMASLPTAKSLLTPTQLAAELKIFYQTGNPNPQAVNKLLQALGYQTKIAGAWSATTKAIEAKLCDRKPVETGSRTQKDQLLWSADVLDILSEHVVAQ